MAKAKRAGAHTAIPAERPVATGELVDIRDLPEYRCRHGLRIVRAEWPLMADRYANGGQRPAEAHPRMIVEQVEQ